MMDGCCARKNSYELYGADFMLTTDLRPWLLEINSSPALGATTSITSRLCSAVLEDVIKVSPESCCKTAIYILSLRSQLTRPGTGQQILEDGNLFTGDAILSLTFRRILKLIRQPAVQQPQYSGISLTVQGTKIQMNPRYV